MLAGLMDEEHHVDGRDGGDGDGCNRRTGGKNLCPPAVRSHFISPVNATNPTVATNMRPT